MIRLLVVASASIGLILLVGFISTRLVRSRSRGLSIRLQVFIALASIVGAFALGLGVMVLDRIDARAQRFGGTAAAEQAELVAQLVGSEMTAHATDLGQIAASLTNGGTPAALDGVELIDRDGRTVFRGHRSQRKRGETTIEAEAPIVEAGDQLGLVRVTKTTLQVEGMLRDFAPTILVISLVLGAAAALSAAWIGRTIAGPIEALSRFSERVASGDHRALAPAVFNGREVTRLTQSLDSMRRQLEGRPFVETFAADLSHELKNPVAAIRASAEVLDDSALDEPQEARRFVRRIREAVARIERLLSELLNLAQVEARGVANFEPVQLSELLNHVVQSLDSRSRVSVVLDPTCKVRGDPTWLTRAISNLIDNALLHSDGQVKVTLQLAGSDVVLSVTNPGAIQQHTKERIFGRFVTTRADKGGTGLGLAIVRAVAEAHRGQVELTCAGPQQVEFQLRFPAA